MDTTLARKLLTENGWSVSTLKTGGLVAVASVVALIACVKLDFELVLDEAAYEVSLTGVRDGDENTRVTRTSGLGNAEEFVLLAVDTKFRAERS
jgi:hypothetical protein